MLTKSIICIYHWVSYFIEGSAMSLMYWRVKDKRFMPTGSFWKALVFVAVQIVPAICAAQSSNQAATLAQYWSGEAQWKLERTWPEGGASGSSHIEVANGMWYEFIRYIDWDPNENGCTRFGVSLGINVRSSLNKGATWSEPVTVVAPIPNKPWTCAASDGDAYYDAVNNKWRLLFQCLSNDQTGPSSKWMGCYAEREGADPMGAFIPVPQNPVINSGNLWSQICNTPQDDCSILAGGPGRVHDEGTFNIFRFDGLYYWVSFHGYDDVRGYRGIAKTTNFITWIAGSSLQGLPADSIVDKNDLALWREWWDFPGAIGVGAGSILLDGGYYYSLTEGADHNLACTNGQHWDLGLFRSSSLTQTTWSSYRLVTQLYTHQE